MFNNFGATVKRKDGFTVLTATKKDDLYVVDEMKTRGMATSDIEDDKLIRWHQRYGHSNITNLNKTKKIVTGVEYARKTDEFKCDVCDQCKVQTPSL